MTIDPWQYLLNMEYVQESKTNIYYSKKDASQ